MKTAINERSYLSDPDNQKHDCHGCFRLTTLIFCTSVLLFFLPLLLYIYKGIPPTAVPCGNACNVQIAETIPADLSFPGSSPKHISIFDAWMDLILSAEESIDIAAFYWTLRNDDLKPPVNDSQTGQKLFDTLIEVGKKKGLKIRIVVDIEENRSNDTKILEKEGVAEVRSINMTRLMGSGVLHTKMWLVDGKHFSVGSANLDWRALTEVKELSTIIKDCPCFADDLSKIFEVYWELAQPDAHIPAKWPSSLSTNFNKDTPLILSMNNTQTETYLSSSPPPFCPDGRTSDIDAILDVMDKAQKFIDISVMTYLPMTEYESKERHFWNNIDAKLRARAMDGKVKVRLMTGYWSHTDRATAGFLQSLAALNNTGLMNIEVKQFVVPLNHFPVVYSRVNHCKFMVTDNAAYVGTSNWSEDYFVDTGGIGFIINNTLSQYVETTSFQQQLKAVFDRDWSSNYTYPVIVPPLKPPPY